MEGSASLGVLFTGFVQKKNPHTGSRKKKFLVLTHVGLHWFRREPGYDLFGEERGCMKLAEITEVKFTDAKVAGDDFRRMFEVSTSTAVHRAFITESENQCEQWVRCIEHAISSKFALKASAADGGASDLSAAVDETFSEIEVLFVTVSCGLSGYEFIVGRNMQWGDMVTIAGEVLGPNDSVVITLVDNGVATLVAKDRLSSKGFVDGFKLAKLQVYGGHLATEVEVGVRRRLQLHRLVVPSVILPVFSAAVLAGFVVPALTSPAAAAAAAAAPLSTPSASPHVLIAMAAFLAWHCLVTAWEVSRGRMWTWDLELREHMQQPSFTVDENDHKTIPKRYIDGCFGNVAEAYRLWYETCNWRKAQRVSGMLAQQQSHYFDIKQGCVHFIAGTAHHGQPIFYLRPGSLDLESMKQQQISGKDLERHFVLLLEFLFVVVAPGEDARAILMLDMRDVTLKHVMGETFDFWRGLVRICQEHYPERCEACFVLNIPPFFSFIFKLARAFVTGSTLKKVQVVAPSQQLDPKFQWFSEFIPMDSPLRGASWWRRLVAEFCAIDAVKTRSTSPTDAVFVQEAELARLVRDLNDAA